MTTPDMQLGSSHTHYDTAFALVDPAGNCKAILPRGTSSANARTMADVLRLKLILVDVSVTMTYISPAKSKLREDNYSYIPKGFGS